MDNSIKIKHKLLSTVMHIYNKMQYYNNTEQYLPNKYNIAVWVHC